MSEFGSPEWRTDRNAKMVGWLLGNRQAMEVALTIFSMVETWDDIVDGDPLDLDDADHGFVGVFVKLELNPFWQSARGFLHPVMVMAINAWKDSDQLKHDDSERLRQLAFHIRNLSTEILLMIVFLVGGWDHLRKVSAEIRRYFQHESYEDWEHKL